MLLYIDPGTGSMLFTILIGIASFVYFFLQKTSIKIITKIRGGRKVKIRSSHMPYVIYTDSKRYWNVFKPVCDIFEERKLPLVYWTSSPDDPALSADYQYIKSEYIGGINKAITRLNVMDAGICLSSTPGLDVYQWKRSKKTMLYAHIGHGVGDITAYRMFGTDFYDTIFLTAMFQYDEIRALEKAHNRPPKELVLAGLSHLDAMKERYRKEYSHIREKDSPFTVLVAPSWGKNSIFHKYGDTIIEGLLQTGYRIIIRPHPQSLTSDKAVLDPLMEKYSENSAVSWNFDNDNFNVLSESDILISDFSGVIFDYVFIFDRPVIYADTSYDSSPCDACWLDRKMWIFESLAKIGVRLKQEDLPNLKTIIDNTVKDEQLRKNRQEVKDSGWQNVGKCAETVADYMICNYEEIKTKKES